MTPQFYNSYLFCQVKNYAVRATYPDHTGYFIFAWRDPSTSGREDDPVLAAHLC